MSHETKQQERERLLREREELKKRIAKLEKEKFGESHIDRSQSS